MTALPRRPPAQPRFLGRRITPLNQRRLGLFRANRRGFWALWIFLALFIVSLFAEFIANDRPLLVSFDGHFYVPVLHDYTETTFGGDFETFADYKDPYVAGTDQCQGLDDLAADPLQLRHGRARSVRGRRPRRPTGIIGSAPTIRPATCWRGSSTAFASRSSSA